MLDFHCSFGYFNDMSAIVILCHVYYCSSMSAIVEYCLLCVILLKTRDI